MKGKFIVIDGIDGVGKGVFLSSLVDAAKNSGHRVFDVHDFWQEYRQYPKLGDIIGKYDTIVTSEPTFVGIGAYIRNELIADNDRNYSAQVIAQAYALDRLILYENLLLPLLDIGINVLQSRSFSSSIVYQRQQSLDEGREFSIAQIMSIPGNKFCAEHPMDFLLVPTIKNVEEAIKRSEERDKDDDCVFENLDFQLKIDEHYKSEEFREYFESLGTRVIYLDAGVSVEYSKEQAREFYVEVFDKEP